VKADVTWPLSTGGLLVEQLQVAGLGVDAVGVDGARLLAAEVVDLANGVEELAAGLDGEEGRVDSLRDEHGRRQLAAGGVEFAAVDALALLAGVGADVDPELLGGGCGQGERKDDSGREPR